MISRRGVGKTWKNNGKPMQNIKLFDGSEPRLALYSSLISHFRHFWKQSKNQWKTEPESHCVRRAQTAAPLGGNRRISISGKVFGKRRKRRTSIKATQNGSQKYQKSMKMGSKIDGKSMKSRGCVADAILVRSRVPTWENHVAKWDPFCNQFRPKI